MPEPAAASAASPADRFDEFLNEGLERHERASKSAGTLTRRFRIAGRVIDFHFAGPSLETAMTAALAHLVDKKIHGEADFYFHLWDEASTGVGPPRPRWDLAEQYSHGEVRSLIDDERYLQVIQPRRAVIAGHHGWGRAIVWLDDGARLAPWERAAPLLALFNWWATGIGHFKVHAAAVGRQEGGVLIVGPSGAGKSHTAIACLDSNLCYVADDHCLFGTADGPNVAGLYSTGKLFTADLHRFPLLAAHRSEAMPTDEGKSIFFFNKILPARLSAGFPIRAVVLPHPAGVRDTRFDRASVAPALRHMATENALRWPSLGRRAFADLAAALRPLPCFRLETGTDLTQIPRAVAAILAAVPAR